MEEFGREVYKLVKLFKGKMARAKKEKDLGQQVRREGAQEETEEFAPLKMAETVQEQIREFKVQEEVHDSRAGVHEGGTSLVQVYISSLILLPSPLPPSLLPFLPLGLPPNNPHPLQPWPAATPLGKNV